MQSAQTPKAAETGVASDPQCRHLWTWSFRIVELRLSDIRAHYSGIPPWRHLLGRVRREKVLALTAPPLVRQDPVLTRLASKVYTAKRTSLLERRRLPCQRKRRYLSRGTSCDRSEPGLKAIVASSVAGARCKDAREVLSKGGWQRTCIALCKGGKRYAKRQRPSWTLPDV